MLSFLSQIFKSEPTAQPAPDVAANTETVMENKRDAEEQASPCAGSLQIQQAIAQPNEAMQQIFQKALQQFVGCQAIACVDIEKNELLAIEAISCVPTEVLPLVASATTDLFTAPNMVKVAQIFKDKAHDDSDSANFNEIIVNGQGTVYLLLRIMNRQNLVCVFSCKDNDNTLLGMLLHEARSLMTEIEKTL